MYVQVNEYIINVFVISDCVYTHGHWINNRSLFPSQDVPEALATWQAYITVPQGLTVIMSGDHNPQCKDSING